MNERLRPVESYLSQGRALRYAEQALFPLLEKARVLVMERRYGEAAELATHLAAEVEALRQRERAAERAVEELRELTLNLDELGLEAREGRDILDMAARQAQQGDPGVAAMLAQRGAQTALRTAADELQERAEKLLAEHRLQRLDGEDLQTAALRLEEMLALSQRGMLEEALHKLRAVEASLKEYERLKELALRDLVEVEQMARTAAQKGVQMDGLAESLTEARVKIEEGNPSAAHALLAAKRGELAWSMQIISSRKEGMAKLRAEADTLVDVSRRQEVLVVLKRAEAKLNEMELIDNDLGMRRAAALIKEARDQEAARQKMLTAIAGEMLAEAGARTPDTKGETWEARKAALGPLLQKARAAAEAAVAKSPTGPGAAMLRKAGDQVAAGDVIDAIEEFRAAAAVAAFSTIDATEYLELRRHALELLDMSFTGAARKERRALSEIESGRTQAAEAMDAVRRLNKELEKAFASTGAVLEMDIDADEAIAREGKQKVLFRLTNNGPVPVHGLELKAETDANVTLPELPPRLEPYSSLRLEMSVEPRAGGELQLRMQLSYMIPTTRRRHRLERTAVLSISG